MPSAMLAISAAAAVLRFMQSFIGGRVDELLDHLTVARCDQILVNRNAQHGHFSIDDNAYQIRSGTAFRPQLADTFLCGRNLALDLTGLAASGSQGSSIHQT